METEKEFKIEAALEIAFMAGRWRGQVDLEEHMENESYFDAFLSYTHARKTGMPLHSVAIDEDLQTRPVRYNLRSDKWREGVKKSVQE
jgi:hypothetical protein